MSMFVSDTGRVMTYAIVDPEAKIVLSAFEWIGEASKHQRRLEQRDVKF